VSWLTFSEFFPRLFHADTLRILQYLGVTLLSLLCHRHLGHCSHKPRRIEPSSPISFERVLGACKAVGKPWRRNRAGSHF
jgi:hypothetical protein